MGGGGVSLLVTGTWGGDTGLSSAGDGELSLVTGDLGGGGGLLREEEED